MIPEAWKYTVLVEAHDKLGHQGLTWTYCLIKWHYYWKGMNKRYKEIHCPVCPLPQRKSKSSGLPTPDDRNSSMFFWQDCCETSSSGNKHIPTIIDHLTGWPQALPITNQSAETIVSTFINQYIPVHMCPRYILSDNGTEFKNLLMDKVLQQLGIEHIFSAPYHQQSNGKLEVFHKYLKPTLKKLCEKDLIN